MKHTPGPWKLESEINIAGSPQFVVTEDYRVISDAYTSDIRDFEEIHSNARLIAAAPELLEHSINLIEYLEGVEGWSENEVVKQLKQAIKKATGE